jgi:hypothetical protein
METARKLFSEEEKQQYKEQFQKQGKFMTQMYQYRPVFYFNVVYK